MPEEEKNSIRSQLGYLQGRNRRKAERPTVAAPLTKLNSEAAKKGPP